MGAHTSAPWNSRRLEVPWLEYIQTDRNVFEIIGWHFSGGSPSPFQFAGIFFFLLQSIAEAFALAFIHRMPRQDITHWFLASQGKDFNKYKTALVALKLTAMEEKAPVLVKGARLKM